MGRLHLVCNAHLDPAWLWEIEEGAGEALSTFRIAADFCEQLEGFVFNHNEVILYKWIEEFDPPLFERIQRLVSEGKWHIMGGWYLQPDCNMPSGESFVRQMLLGRTYFREKFASRPTTAINFDPFGHTRGLVQLMSKAGFDSYIICRPGDNDCPLPADDFIWVGLDGSEIAVHRGYKGYLSGKGRAHLKVEGWLADHSDQALGLVLWGIGNHGGGPSRIDLTNLQQLKEQTSNVELIHSTPEAYFKELLNGCDSLPKHEKDLNPWAVGCYTSQIRIKQKHRALENEVFLLEKMMSSCALQGLTAYPAEAIHEAICDLMVAEFHDILPGSSVQPVEEASLRLMDHGLEIISRQKFKAFLALTSGQPQAQEGEVPIFVYNPHPYPVRGIFECEFQLPVSSRDQFAVLEVRSNGQGVPCQTEKELSSLYIDWRKRVVFYAELQPGQMNRFDCTVEKMTPGKPLPLLRPKNGVLYFKTDDLEVNINCATGLVDEYKVRGVSYVMPGAFCPIVLKDNDDAWGQVHRFPGEIGRFKLMSKAKGSRYAGLLGKPLESVRVIEDGEVRTVVEALFHFGDSMICQRYFLPKQGTEIEVRLTVHWNEKRRMLKFAIPTVFTDAKYRGQVAYGTEDLPTEGREVVAQKWTAVLSESGENAFTCINDGIYGSDLSAGEMRLTLLRSPGYSALPGGKKPNTMPQDRYSERIDQGERFYHFWFNAGDLQERFGQIDGEALAHNEKPYILSYFPSGQGDMPLPLAKLSDETVQMSAFKKAERGDDFIIRLFEPTGKDRLTLLSIPAAGIEREIHLSAFEVKTLRLDVKNNRLIEGAIMEDE